MSCTAVELEESFLRYGWSVAEDRTENYGFTERLQSCAERPLEPRPKHLERISNATKLLKRRFLRLDSNASNIRRLVVNMSCERTC